MVAKRGGAHLIGVVAVAAMAALLVSGCSFGKSQPTPIVVVLTPTPEPTVAETVAPSESPTPSPTPVPSSTAALSPTPTSSPTAPPQAAGVSATKCTGSTDSQAFWASASTDMAWDVYCPVLPAGWLVSKGSFDGVAGGTIGITMNGPSGARLAIDEGAFCTTDPGSCSPHVSVLGAAKFGDLSGSLDGLSGGGLAVYVRPGTSTAYRLTGSGMSQAAFVSIAAAFVKVAKS